MKNGSVLQTCDHNGKKDMERWDGMSPSNSQLETKKRDRAGRAANRSNLAFSRSLDQEGNGANRPL